MEDGTLQIVGWDTLGVNVFKYEIKDKDTLSLKIDTDKIPLDEIEMSEVAAIESLNFDMDYEISKDTLKLSLVGEELTLYRK